MALYPDRYFEWTRRLVPPLGFYAEHWRSPADDPDLPALAAKYGESAVQEVSLLRVRLLEEVVTAAGGLLHTLMKLEALLAEMQDYVEQHVAGWPVDEPRPEFGYGISHPLLVEASFEFANFLGWLRSIDERLDRRHLSGSGDLRAGLLPALAERPLRRRVETLIREFRTETRERNLANYVLHAATVPPPLEGARLTDDREVRLRIPDPPSGPIPTRWHLTYREERDALSRAREVASATESLVDGLLEAFEREKAVIEQDRERQVRALGASAPTPSADR
jgi:hypothetical protein